MKTIEFMLSDPIEFQTGGETTQSSMLELTAPAVNNRKRVAKLKQGFMRVIKDLQEDKSVKKSEDKGEHELKADEFLALIQMGSVDYADYMDIFVNLLVSGVCKIEGKVPLNNLRAEEISFEDMEKLLGEYVVNFILGSLGK